MRPIVFLIFGPQRYMIQCNSPLQLIPLHPGNQDGVSLYVKRDDLLHPDIHGNKWRKLAPVLRVIKNSFPAGVVTFGGAFSNHLHAVAAAGRIFDFPTYGIVRGVHADTNNPTLSAARANGMQLFPISKQLYETIQQGNHPYLLDHFTGCYILPEGGSGKMAFENCKAIASEIRHQLAAQGHTSNESKYICVPAGTGCTAAGIIAGLEPGNNEKAFVFPVVNKGFDAQNILQKFDNEHINPEILLQYFHLIYDYEFGGFAKYDPALMHFVARFQAQTGILPDPVYTAKMFYGVYNMLEKRIITPNSVVVMVHTGGLQGWEGFRKRYPGQKEK